MSEREKPTPEQVEARDQGLAERGDRLVRFVRGEPVAGIWEEDILPLLEKLHRSYFNLSKEKDPGALWGVKAIEDLGNALCGSIELGRGAMRRIVERRLGAKAMRGTG